MNKLLRLTVSALLLSWLAWHTDWDQVRGAFEQMRIQYWLAAVGLLGVTQFVSAIRWRVIAQQLRFGQSLGQLTGFYFIGMYFNLMLPTSVGGDVIRAYYLDGRSGRRLAAFASVFLDRLNGLMVLVALACLSVLLSPLELPTWVHLSVWGVAASGACGLVALPWIGRLGRLSPARIEQLGAALRMTHRPRILVAATLLSIFVQVANVALVWLVGLAIRAQVPATFYWVLVPMVSLLTLLPVSVNGMGVREGATAILLAPLGVDQGTALTLAFLWFAVHASVSLLGGLVYLFGRFPKPDSPAQSPGEVSRGSFDCDSDQGRAGQHCKAA